MQRQLELKIPSCAPPSPEPSPRSASDRRTSRRRLPWRLADQSAWHIETDDLTEINVVFVKEGDRARITVDALPDVELMGTVVRIKPLGENKQGDITYTATIADAHEERLRWNMTASVTILTESKSPCHGSPALAQSLPGPLVQKARTILVLLSIAVGVSAIGMVMGAIIVDRNLPEAYTAINPASATIYTFNTFDDRMVEAVEALSQVAEAGAPQR